jgi:hypothetical protein
VAKGSESRLLNVQAELHASAHRTAVLLERLPSMSLPTEEGMSESTREQEFARMERQALLKDEQMRRTDAVLAEEDRRRAADAAKTARLRELRLAKEATERATAPQKKPKRRQ